MIKNLISTYDTQNQFEVLKNSHTQIDDAWNKKINLGKIRPEKINSVLICGLGGSAISGDLLQNFFSGELDIPVFVSRNYKLPSYVDRNWLILISSYSGNTEETISCLKEAIKLKTEIVTVSSGGKIEDISKNNSIPHIRIPSGFQPRYALGLSFFTLIKIFRELNLVRIEDEVVKSFSELWRAKGEEYSRSENPALKIAKKLIGFIPVIYSSEVLSSAGYRFKCQLNENSKIHSFHHVIPEMNHNEIIGWETQKEKQFNAKIILLFDDNYNPQVKKRYFIFSELVLSKGIEVINLTSSEKSLQLRIMDLIYLCDWISFYLAVLRGFDPSEIDFIHEMKKRLA